MKKRKLIPIGEAAKLLGVTITTLRRWDESGRMTPVRKSPKGNRYYHWGDIEFLTSELSKMARGWAVSKKSFPEEYYCRFSDIFQARLIQLETLLAREDSTKNIFSLIISIVGEIGNNSFDHNLGQWPDTPGIFFGYDLVKKQIVLADQGLGILETLKRVRPSLKSHDSAVKVAFTEILSGRAPESRGNGLKYVRKVVAGSNINLFFQSGNAKLWLYGGSSELAIKKSRDNVKGCLAFITY